MIKVPNLPNLNGLVELANRDGVDIRPTLLRVMTDLYVQKPSHSEQEEQHFTELALRLIDLVDAKTRAIVAERIGGYPTAPDAVRRRLLKEQVTVTTPIDTPKALVVAEASQVLEPTKPDGPLDHPSSGGNSDAASPELSELFFAASAEERQLILFNLSYAPIVPAQPITPAIASESIHRLEAAALGHNSELFARELERTLFISREMARRIIDDESGEPVVIAAAALRMPAAVLQRILLCLNPAISQSVQRVYELALLHEETEPETALRMIAIWQAARRIEGKHAVAAKPAHQPQLWHDERSERAAPATRPKIRWEEHAQSRKAEGA